MFTLVASFLVCLVQAAPIPRGSSEEQYSSKFAHLDGLVLLGYAVLAFAAANNATSKEKMVTSSEYRDSGIEE